MLDIPKKRSNKNLLPYYLILFGMSSGLASVVTLVAEFKQELGFSDFEIGLTIFSGFASSFISLIVLAPHADRGYAPLLLKSGLLLGIIALLLLAIGDSLWQFIIGRGLFGFALGATAPAARRTVIVSNPSELGRNLGKLGAYDVSGWVIGPVITVVLNSIGNFKTPFWVMAALLLALVPTAWKTQADTAKYDSKKRGIADLLRIRQLNGALLILAAYFVFLGTFESVWVLELDSRGASQWQIGIAVTLAALPIPLLSIKGGVLAQRFGPRIWTVGSLTTCAVIMSFFGLFQSVFALIFITVICSCVEGIGFPAGPMLISSSVPEERQAAAQGLGSAAQVAAAAVASLLAAALYQITNDTIVWICTSITMLLLISLGWLLTKPPSSPTAHPRRIL